LQNFVQNAKFEFRPCPGFSAATIPGGGKIAVNKIYEICCFGKKRGRNPKNRLISALFRKRKPGIGKLQLPSGDWKSAPKRRSGTVKSADFPPDRPGSGAAAFRRAQAQIAPLDILRAMCYDICI